MEMWGGATFDVAVRFLKDDPWERVRTFKKYVKKTPLKMVLRGQNLVGYKAYPDDVVEAFIAQAAEAGIDVFLTFDALQDLRNCETAFKAIKKAGKKIEGSVQYNVSPFHTPECLRTGTDGCIPDARRRYGRTYDTGSCLRTDHRFEKSP